MSSKQFRIGLFVIAGLLILVVGAYFVILRPHSIEAGIENEVTPALYSAMRLRWAAEGPDHYRIVARYHYQVGGCSEDVEVMNERVISVYKSDCERPGFLTVSAIFDMFEDFVGYGITRPVASNQCMYYYVTGTFDSATGYPQYMKNHLDWTHSRGRQTLSYAGSFECLTIGPPIYTATIESVTPLE